MSIVQDNVHLHVSISYNIIIMIIIIIIIMLFNQGNLVSTKMLLSKRALG